MPGRGLFPSLVCDVARPVGNGNRADRTATNRGCLFALVPLLYLPFDGLVVGLIIVPLVPLGMLAHAAAVRSPLRHQAKSQGASAEKLTPFVG